MQNFLCSTWQGLLQQLTYQIGRGYGFYCLTYLPVTKKDSWQKIDEKLIQKYDCDRSKFQRYRAKSKGEANYMYIRWSNIALILRTSAGELRPESDQFLNIEEKPLFLRISPLVEFMIHRKRRGKTTIFLSRETYRGLKDTLYETAIKDHLPKPAVAKFVLSEWNKTNGFPSYAGIVEQRSQLLDYILKLCRKHQIPLKRGDFRFYTKRTIVKVWSD